jgi:hypothetical protein
MSDIAISVKNVSKTFRIPHEKVSSLRGAAVSMFSKKRGFEEFKALDDVSFEVKKGGVFWNHWAKWEWEEHAAQNSGWNLSSRQRKRQNRWADFAIFGTWNWIQSAAFGQRQYSSECNYAGNDQSSLMINGI